MPLATKRNALRHSVGKLGKKRNRHRIGAATETTLATSVHHADCDVMRSRAQAFRQLVTACLSWLRDGRANDHSVNPHAVRIINRTKLKRSGRVGLLGGDVEGARAPNGAVEIRKRCIDRWKVRGQRGRAPTWSTAARNHLVFPVLLTADVKRHQRRPVRRNVRVKLRAFGSDHRRIHRRLRNPRRELVRDIRKRRLRHEIKWNPRLDARAAP